MVKAGTKAGTLLSGALVFAAFCGYLRAEEQPSDGATAMLDSARRIAASVFMAEERVDALIKVADAYAELGRPERSSEVLKAALGDVDSLAVLQEQFDTLKQIAPRLAAASDDPSEAQEVYARAVELIIPLAMEQRIDEMLSDIMVSFADDCGFESASGFIDSLPEAKLRVSVLAKIAEHRLEVGDVSEAVAIFGRAEQAARSAEDFRARAELLAAVADGQNRAGAKEAARSSLQQAEQTLTLISKPFDKDVAISRIAAAYAAIGYPEEALQLAEAIQTYSLKAEAIGELGACQARAGNNEEALETIGAIKADGARRKALQAVLKAACEAGNCAEALRIAQGQPGEHERAVCLTSVTDAASAYGDYNVALQAILSMPIQPQRERALGQFVTKYVPQMSLTQSGEVLTEALQHLRAIESYVPLDAMMAIADRYVQAGEIETALGIVSDAESTFAKFHSIKGQSRPLSIAVFVLTEAGQLETADSLVRQTREWLGQKCASCPDVDRVAFVMAFAERGLFDAAIQLSQDITNGPLKAGALNEINSSRARSLMQVASEAAGQERADLVSAALDQVFSTMEEMRDAKLRAEMLVTAVLPWAESGIPLPERYVQAARAMAESAEENRSKRVVHSKDPEAGDVARLAVFYPVCCPMEAEISGFLSSTPWVNVRSYRLDIPESRLSNLALCEAMAIPEKWRLRRAIFSANDVLIDRQLTLDAIKELAESARGLPAPWEVAQSYMPAAEKSIRGYYKALSFAAVVSAALLDGINPCAFTVIIFFVSYLSYLQRSRKTIALGGIVFTAAVFVAYLAIGFGLTGAIRLAEHWSTLFSQILYLLTALFALAVAVVSFVDGVRCVQGRPESMKLKLPEKLKTRIRLTISHRARVGLTVLTTLVLGAAVGVLEFPCTGQIYLPTIMFAVQSDALSWGPVGWLLLYNVCFILPLIVIFLLVFFGLSSDQLTRFFKKHMAKTKFGIAVVFSGLFILMVVSAWLA